MLLTEQKPDGQYHLKGYTDDSITINDATYTHSILLAPSTLITDGLPDTLEGLTPTHLDDLLALKPDLILLGTGPTFQVPPAALILHCQTHHVRIDYMSTPAACRTYVALGTDGRSVAAVLLYAHSKSLCHTTTKGQVTQTTGSQPYAPTSTAGDAQPQDPSSSLNTHTQSARPHEIILQGCDNSCLS